MSKIIKNSIISFLCFSLFVSTVSAGKVSKVQAEETGEVIVIEYEQTDMESLLEDQVFLEGQTLELEETDFQLITDALNTYEAESLLLEKPTITRPTTLTPTPTTPIGETTDAVAYPAGIGSYITAIKIIGIGTVAIYTGGIIIKGIVAKAGTKLYNSVKNYVVPYVLGATIPKSLRKDGNTVDLGVFKDKYGNTPVGRTSGTYTNGQWTIEKDYAGHGGRKWKIKKSGKRKASLDGSGNIIAD